MLGFKNRAPDIKLLKFTQIETIKLTSRNMISNGSSFQNSETAIGFVASKRIREWSRILISILGCLCTQNEAKLN